MTDEVELAHSPLGGSGAERWMNCPGSQALLRALKLPEGSGDSDFAAEGTAAHEAAAECLLKGSDAWELIGLTYNGHVITEDHANNIQVYLDECRRDMVPGATVKIEQRIGKRYDGTRPHPLYYGSVDFSAYGEDLLVITDFKFGVGIPVEPEWNAQCMYYAFGILISRPMVRSDREVRIKIVQPRCFHPDGPVREWVTTAGEILEWGNSVLLPAMLDAEISERFLNGKWCRFCPAKIVCPILGGMFGAAAKADASQALHLNPERLAAEYAEIETVKMYIKAIEDEVYRRNMAGHTVPGTKLIKKRAFRVFKDGATELFKLRFGEEAFTKPELKSPADMEKVSPDAKKLTQEWAYTPDNGLTVAVESHKSAAIKVETIQQRFAQFEGVKYE